MMVECFQTLTTFHVLIKALLKIQSSSLPRSQGVSSAFLARRPWRDELKRSHPLNIGGVGWNVANRVFHNFHMDQIVAQNCALAQMTVTVPAFGINFVDFRVEQGTEIARLVDQRIHLIGQRWLV